jgi:uncharacterized membrane protein YcaP (DUF421 family)
MAPNASCPRAVSCFAWRGHCMANQPMIGRHAKLDDWQRLLVGDAPWAILVEVLLRTALIYLVLIVIVKLLGKRLSGQLTNLELAVMVVVGAIVSAPMQIPDRGLLAGAVSLVVLLALQRAIGHATAVWPRLERWVFGRGTTLVADGELLLPAMRRACVSHEQVYAILRSHGVRQLGEVERVYLEASGAFSVLRRAQPEAGLALVPTRAEQQAASSETPSPASVHGAHDAP